MVAAFENKCPVKTAPPATPATAPTAIGTEPSVTNAGNAIVPAATPSAVPATAVAVCVATSPGCFVIYFNLLYNFSCNFVRFTTCSLCTLFASSISS